MASSNCRVPPISSSSSRLAICINCCERSSQPLTARRRSSQAVCNVKPASGAQVSNTSNSNRNRSPEDTWPHKRFKTSHNNKPYHNQPPEKKRENS